MSLSGLEPQAQQQYSRREMDTRVPPSGNQQSETKQEVRNGEETGPESPNENGPRDQTEKNENLNETDVFTETGIFQPTQSFSSQENNENGEPSQNEDSKTPSLGKSATAEIPPNKDIQEPGTSQNSENSERGSERTNKPNQQPNGPDKQTLDSSQKAEEPKKDVKAKIKQKIKTRITNDLEKTVFKIDKQQPKSALKISERAIEGKSTRIPTKFGDKELTSLLDTGADPNVAGRNHVDLLGGKLEPYTGPAILSGTEHAFHVLGQINTEIQLGEEKFPINFITVGTELACPIIGDPWLRAQKAVISYEEMGLKIGKTTVPFVVHQMTARASKDIKIKEKESRFVKCVTNQKIEDGMSYVVDPSEFTLGALRTARQVVRARNGHLYIFIANWGEETIHIKAGGLVGWSEKVGEHEIRLYRSKGKKWSDGEVKMNLVLHKAQKSYQDFITPDNDTRYAKIGEQNTPKQKSEILDFLAVWTRVFSPTPNAPATIKGEGARILTNGGPVSCMPRRVNPIKQAEIIRQINVMLKAGIIEPSTGPWASPVVLAPKKDGSFRFCIDYREVNKVMIKDAFPVPRIDDTLDALGNLNAKIFSTLDCAAGYWQMKLHSAFPGDNSTKEKTAFCTSSGTYQFTTLPFGISVAPALFCRAMQSTLAGLLWKCCLCFVDDIIVWSPDYESHFEDLEKVFKALERNGFSLKLSKCNFFKTKLEYLGYTISAGSISTCPSKVQAIAEFPPPRDIKSLQRFLGMAGWYRRLIKDFARICAPLYGLLKTGPDKPLASAWQIHVLGSEQNIAFETLKKALTSSPVLALPSWDRRFIISADGSATGTGGVLLQTDPVSGLERPVAYTSKIIKPSKRNYHGSYRHEILALVRALRAFRHYVVGTKILIATDCSGLARWKNTKEIVEHAGKYLDEIESYDFELLHRPGTEMVVPDCLSRQNEAPSSVFTVNFDSDEIQTVFIKNKQRNVVKEKVFDPTIEEINASILGMSPEHIRQCQRKSIEARRVYDHLVHGALPSDDRLKEQVLRTSASMVVNNGTIFYVPPAGTLKNIRAWIPDPEMQKQICNRLHDDLVAGHLGIEKTRQRVVERFYWSNIEKTVTEHVSNCYSCKVNKPQHGKVVAKLEPLPIGAPWQDVQGDLIDGLPTTAEGHCHIATFICRFTKWIEMAATKSKSADEVGNLLMERVILRWGTPQTFLCDNAGTYDGDFAAALKKLKIENVRVLPYAHNSNGLAERFNKTIEEILRHFVNSNLSNWHVLLPYVQFALNTSVAKAHGYTPFFLNTGRVIISPFAREIGFEDERILVDDYQYETTKRIQEGNRAAKEAMKLAQEKQIANHVPTKLQYKIGDFIKIRYPEDTKNKLHSVFHGPWRLVGKQGENNLILEANGKQIIHHTKDAELWQGDHDPNQKVIPQEIPLSEGKEKEQKKIIEYAKKHSTIPGRQWLPTDLIGRRIMVTWNQRHAKGDFAGFIKACAKGKKQFLVEYDVPDKKGNKVYTENLLGKRHSKWYFLDLDQWKKKLESLPTSTNGPTPVPTEQKNEPNTITTDKSKNSTSTKLEQSNQSNEHRPKMKEPVDDKPNKESEKATPKNPTVNTGINARHRRQCANYT